MPKGMMDNLLWRHELRKKATGDAGFQSDLLAACSESCLFWLNAFGWTYRQREVDPQGVDRPVIGDRCHTPFITWPIQDEAITELQLCIQGGEDANIEKSRDMGASWLVLAMADWYMLFKSDVNIGAVSRKESLVDAAGDMDSLFEKIRYINGLLPSWMLPKITSRFMFLRNTEKNSTIAGESTNADVGRGGRKSWYLVDEAAAIRNGEEIEASLSQNTVCQIWASTPKGPNTAFHQRIKEGRGKRIALPWYRHPEKAIGATQYRDITDKIKWTSPWFQRQEMKFSAKTIAQEIEMDHGRSGDMFFDHNELERHRLDHEAPPLAIGDLMPVTDMNEDDQLSEILKGNLDKFMFLRDAGRSPLHIFAPTMDRDRLDQDLDYTIGADIGTGAGDSNSTMTVYCVDTGRVVAKWWDAFTSPEELAFRAVLLGMWVGGRKGAAFICYENNGAGGIFGRKLIKSGYPRYYRQKSVNSASRKKSDSWGWNSNAANKSIMLGEYRDALAKDRCINPCKESIDEAADYIYDSAGTPIPSVLSQETSGGRALHGDHVIADALAYHASLDLHKQRKYDVRVAKTGSFAYRKDERATKRKNRRSDEQIRNW